MKRWKLWILSVCCVAAFSLAHLYASSPVAKRCVNNTVVVQTGPGHGSGILFTRPGGTFIWTAAHVIQGVMRPDGSFRDVMIRHGSQRAMARVLRCGDAPVAQDIALLQIIEGSLEGDARFYKAFNEVEVGQEIIHCGSPFDNRLNENLLFFGHISHVGRMFSLPNLEPRIVDQCDVNALPGCSGGPIFDAETGDVLGFLSMAGAPGLTAVVPTRCIYEWAKTHDCLWAFDPEIPLPASITPWVGDRLDRIIEARDTSEIDARWGEADLEPEVAE